MTEPTREEEPHYHGHRDRLRARFTEAGGDALPDYELLELLLFRSIPRRDVKPVAKELIRRFGTFAEPLGAPPAPLHGDGRHRRKRRHRPQDRRGRGPAPRKGRRGEAPRAVVLERGHRLLPRRHGVCR